MATNDLFGIGSGGNDDGGGAAMDIDEELGVHHSGVQVAHNVSMDAGCGGESPGTPKRRANVGPIFDESEFEPAGGRLQVHQSALTTKQQNQNQQPAKKKQMTRQEHAKLMREQKQAKFLEKRELAQQKMMQSSICTQSTNNGNNNNSSSNFQVQTIANATNSNSKEDAGRVVGSQLGQPFRQYSDVSVRLAKLRANFDQIMTGQMSISEVYE